jgi:hypothetical protein
MEKVRFRDEQLNITANFFGSLETVFRVKILKFSEDLEFFRLLIRDGKILIRDKHPGSATLLMLSRTDSEMVKAQTLSHGTLVKILLVVCATENAKKHIFKDFITYHS